MATKSKVAANTVFSVLGDTLESAAESFEEATANSRDSAKRAAATTKRALGIGVHKAAYGIAFGLVYSAVFITEMLPKDHIIRRGFIEGTEEALDSRRKAQAARQASKNGSTPKTTSSGKKPKASTRAKKAVSKRAADFDAAVEAA
jgi:hypothetical protein